MYVAAYVSPRWEFVPLAVGTALCVRMVVGLLSEAGNENTSQKTSSGTSMRCIRGNSGERQTLQKDLKEPTMLRYSLRFVLSLPCAPL